MAYTIKYQKQAVLDAAKLQRSEPQAFKKLLKLESELREHPRTGTGHPRSSESREERMLASFSEMQERRQSQQLKGNRSNQWSRRITEKHRLVYEIYDNEVVVLVLTAYGHYEDQ